MLAVGSRTLPLRISEGGYEVLYGPEYNCEWKVEGFFGPPHPEIDSTSTIRPTAGADIEDALVVASAFSLKFDSTVVCDWDPPVVVSRLRMEGADALEEGELERVAARLNLVQDVGALSLDDIRLIGQMTKTGVREYGGNS